MEHLDFSHLIDETPLGALQLARGYFEDISYGAGELIVSGWVLLPDREFDAMEIRLNGEPAGSAPLGVREDVANAFPQIPHARRCGFRFRVPRPVTAVTPCRVDVLGVEQDRPVARLSTLFRADLATVIPTPPADLMNRVAATRDSAFFKIGGLKSFGEFLAPLSRHRPLPSVPRMLDWGCGCGRVTAHFLLDPAGVEVHGCDIDPEAVSWCTEHLTGGQFTHIQPWPPTPYASSTFDLVIAFSVFTHLARDVQKAWLTEIRRVIAPGGVFLASVHGAFAAGFLDSELAARLSCDGIVDDTHDSALDGIAPAGYYRGVFQTREYTRRTWSQWFEIVEYIERGMGNFQDLVVMRRPPARPARCWRIVPGGRQS